MSVNGKAPNFPRPVMSPAAPPPPLYTPAEVAQREALNNKPQELQESDSAGWLALLLLFFH